MLHKIIVSSVVSLGGLYLFYGLHKIPQIKTETMDYEIFLYKPFQGDYWSMRTVLADLKKEFSDISTSEFTLGGFYYDNPRNMHDRTHGRVALGGFLYLKNKAIAEEFLTNHPEYASLEMKPMDAIETDFHYSNYLSFKLSRMMKTRSKLYRYGFKNHYFSQGDKSLIGLIELYPYLTGQENKIKIILPYGKNTEQFKSLIKLPEPKLKSYQYPGIIGDFNYIFFNK